MTAICVPIFVRSGTDLEAAIGEAEEALGSLERHEKMIELRCDTATPRQMLEAIDLASVPLIVTVRPTWEGGFSEKSDNERIAVWEQAMEAGAEYIDVELVAWEKSKAVRESIEEIAEKTGTRLILSSHQFKKNGDIADRLARLRAVKAAHILKLAWMASSVTDALDALRLMRNKKEDPRPLVALTMGEEGMLSRVLAKKFGAPFTFATARAGKESAPGQPTVAELVERYRWKQQTPETPVFGVVGWPVGHSLSPLIHNAGFEALNLPGVYVPLAMAAESPLENEISTLRKDFHLRGLSVTIPHKEHAMQYARAKGAAIDELSAHIGVINTLSWDAAGKLSAFNFDYAGAMDALAAAWGEKREILAGKKVAVLGAGGAARAIVAGLAAYHANTTIFNRRTPERAVLLAQEFDGREGRVRAGSWEELPNAVFDAVINCTPLGMHPKIHASPIDFDPNWSAETVVFDTIYNPIETRLIKLARKKGARVVPGVEMFIGQAALQFKQFTGRDAPVDLFRALLLKALGK